MASPPRAVTDSPLTRREREVSRLVSDGLTNKEIGQRLFLSERTVEGHVASISNKLGFHSRVQIAAWEAKQSSQPRAVGDSARPAWVWRRLPPWWVLGIMLGGLPLPVGAAIYQWTASPPPAFQAPVVDSLVTLAAMGFVALPAICLAGLENFARWSQPLAVIGLLVIGSLILLTGIIVLGLSMRAGWSFQPADGFEAIYAAALVPLLLVHVVALGAAVRNHPLSQWLVSAVCVVWIVRFGYGLSLAALVLWFLWLRPREARSDERSK